MPFAYAELLLIPEAPVVVTVGGVAYAALTSKHVATNSPKYNLDNLQVFTFIKFSFRRRLRMPAKRGYAGEMPGGKAVLRPKLGSRATSIILLLEAEVRSANLRFQLPGPRLAFASTIPNLSWNVALRLTRDDGSDRRRADFIFIEICLIDFSLFVARSLGQSAACACARVVLEKRKLRTSLWCPWSFAPAVWQAERYSIRLREAGTA